MNDVIDAVTEKTLMSMTGCFTDQLGTFESMLTQMKDGDEITVTTVGKVSKMGGLYYINPACQVKKAMTVKSTGDQVIVDPDQPQLPFEEDDDEKAD